MRGYQWRQATMVMLALVLALPAVRAQGSVGAQAPVTSADLTRLDRTADDIAARADALKGTDPTLADEISKHLADLRDDITYLKVKLRKEGSVGRPDYDDLHDRLETLKNRAMGDRVTAQPV